VTEYELNAKGERVSTRFAPGYFQDDVRLSSATAASASTTGMRRSPSPVVRREQRLANARYTASLAAAAEYPAALRGVQRPGAGWHDLSHASAMAMEKQVESGNEDWQYGKTTDSKLLMLRLPDVWQPVQPHARLGCETEESTYHVLAEG